MTTTRIIIPCYNEAKRLRPEAFLRALSNEPGLRFLFVNDGSSDTTLHVLTTLREKNPGQISILNLARNSGKAEAVRRGMLEALTEPCDYVGYWDADLATPLDAIGEFLSVFNHDGIEAVIGSRVCLLGRKIQRKAWRHYVGRVFATCVSLLLRLKIYDTQCGAKLFKNTPILHQIFCTPFKVTWTFDVELLARFILLRGMSPGELASTWVEYPLHEWKDIKGSKIGIKDYIRGGVEFCTLFFFLHTPARNSYRRDLQTACFTPFHDSTSG